MMYTCSQCGRIMDYPEALSFCPFCATAYDPSESETDALKAQADRAAVSQERSSAVQIKYWHMARLSFLDALELLYDQVIDQDGSAPMQINFNAWLNEQRMIKSGLQFVRRCDSMIGKIHEAFTNQKALELSEPLNLEAKADEINRVCLRLAEALGSDNPQALRPELKYRENGRNNTQPMPETLKADEAEHELLEAVLRARPAFYRALDEGGIYIAFPVSASASDEDLDGTSPANLARTLDTLAKKDYDPLFGEQYDGFISAFWLSLKALTKAVNRLHKLPGIDKDEAAKRLALETLSDDWAEALGLALDRTYQKGQLNMMYVYSDVSSICKELETLSKAEPDGSEDEEG